MPHLIMDRDGHTRQYEVKGELTIGRSSENTIQIPTGKASRRHCRIFESSGRFFLEDLGSSNGTRRNGAPVTVKTALQNKDTIEIGGLVLTYLDADDDPLVGTRLGKYHILEPLGKGGMGSVYRARQIPINRDVALKVLNPALVSRKGFVESFQREARLAASLQHPNIIGIHDFGVENDWHYFSMEFVDGENLLDRMARQGPLTADEIVAFGTQVCEALDHAHEKRILHQDIKPHNIMVNRESAIKVADLGLANVMHYSAEADEERVSMGTPQYVAPEIIRRRAPDARTDLYSLSATLYHLVTGTIPFDATSLKDMLQKHLKDPVPDPRAVIPDIPAPLAELLMRGLSKDPARRPESAAVYGGLLRAAIRVDRPVPKAPARPAGTAYPESGTRATQSLAPVSAPSRDIRPRKEFSDGEKGSARIQEPVSTRIPKRKAPGSSYLLPVCLILGFLALGLGLVYKTDVFQPASVREAERDLAAAREVFASNPANARTLLERLVRRYPDTPAAREAQTLLTASPPAGEDGEKTAPSGAAALEKIVSDHEAGWLARDEARARLRALLEGGSLDGQTASRAQAFLDTLQAEEQEAAAEAGDPSLAVWAELDGIVSRLIEQQRFGDARTMILQFRENHPDSGAHGHVEQRLRGLDAILARGEAAFQEAEAALAQGNTVEARRLYARIQRDLPGTEWASRAREGQSRLDRLARERFFAGWQSFLDAVGRFDTEAAQGIAVDLQAQLEGSIWERASSHLVQLADALSRYEEALLRSVARLASREGGRSGHAPQFRVQGIGLVTLAMGDGGGLQGIGEGGDVHSILLEAIPPEDLPALVTVENLTEQQALGAALYAFVRGDAILGGTYLAAVGEEGIYASARHMTRAMANRRVLSQMFRFVREERSHEHWHPTPGSGPWRFGEDRLAASTAVPSTIRLPGRQFGMGDMALSVRLEVEEPTGQAGVILSQDERQYLAFWIRDGSVLFQSAIQGRTQQAEGSAGHGDDPWRLEVRNGHAVLYAGQREAASLDVAGTERWEVEIRLDFTDTPGHVDWIVIEEGDGRGASG